MKYQLYLIQIYYRIISAIAPVYASKKAANLFQTVRKKNIREREQRFYQEARHYKLAFDLEPLDIYELGDESAPPLLLLHGWDSNVGSMSEIAKVVVTKGYKVISMNLPAHAFSKRDKTNFHECKTAFQELINHVNPIEPISVIAHSFGSGLTAAAFSELDYKADKLIFLTSPNKMIDFFDEFKKIIGLGDKAYQIMCNWASEILGEDLREMKIANKIKDISYNELLLIHDKKDKVLPFSNTEEIHAANPYSKIDDHVSVGHYRMLWNNEVLETIRNTI